jgi:hypothetical protein
MVLVVVALCLSAFIRRLLAIVVVSFWEHPHGGQLAHFLYPYGLHRWLVLRAEK